MTQKGMEFVARVKEAVYVANTGQPVFAAMACTLEDDDWLLVYAAMCKMAKEIEESSGVSA